MKRILAVIVMAVLLLTTGCTKKYTGLETPLSGAQPDESTISDGGYAARQGDWIYFINGDNFTRETERFHAYAGALCRMRQDGTDQDVVVTQDVSVFNISGDYIYMAVYEDQKSWACRVKVDGTGYQNFGEIDDIYYGGCYAYTGGYFYYTKNFCLWRMNGDGTGKIQITKFKVYNLRAGDKYLYFTREEDDTIGKIYRLKNGESTYTEITSTPGYVLDVQEQYMYFYLLENSKVYRLDQQTEQTDSLLYGGYEEYVFAGDVICASYSEDNEANEPALYALPADGGTRKKLADYAASRMVYHDGWVYYINDSSLTELWRSNVETGKTEKVSGEFVCDIDTLDIVDGYLYFFSDSDEGRIYRINLDSLAIECVEYEEFGIVG